VHDSHQNLVNQLASGQKKAYRYHAWVIALNTKYLQTHAARTVPRTPLELKELLYVLAGKHQ
jgi:hypothetical protein